MFLTTRMVLYFLFGWLSGTGIGLEFDPATGMAQIHVDALAQAAVGVGGFVATFAVSRVAKARGGTT